MLPALVDELKTVTIWIKDASCVVARIIVKSRARRTVVSCTSCDSGSISRVYLLGAPSYKTDMGSMSFGISKSQPEECA